MSVIRPKVLRYLTERPGSIIYKDEMMDALRLEPGQVTAAVRGIQRESPIGSEIETVQHGNAWRYLPNRPIVPSVDRRAIDVTRPLTLLLKEYFLTHPHTVVHIDQLVTYTGRTEEQVRVGVNNMRTGHPDVRPYVHKLLDGQSYRYSPPDAIPTPPRPATTVPTPVASPPRPTSVPTTKTPVDDGTSGRLFEEIGRIDGDVIVRDSDDGALYRVLPLR